MNYLFHYLIIMFLFCESISDLQLIERQLIYANTAIGVEGNLDSLRAGRSISSDIIDRYIFLLNKYQSLQFPLKNKHNFCFSFIETIRLLKGDYVQDRNLFKYITQDIAIFDLNHIILPVLQDVNTLNQRPHWMFIHVNVKLRLVSAYSSQEDRATDSDQVMLLKVVEWLRVEARLRFGETTPYWQEWFTRRSEQTRVVGVPDAVMSCGLYTIVAISSVINGKPIVYRREDENEYRQRIGFLIQYYEQEVFKRR